MDKPRFDKAKLKETAEKVATTVKGFAELYLKK